jgi:Superfamily II DNA/RNA helicases, SNF2 family
VPQNYSDFIQTKLVNVPPTGIAGDFVLSDHLFGFQKDLVSWALKRGRCAIFAATGLGKTRMQLEWAKHVSDHTGFPVLILAPLAVGAQTVSEAKIMGIGAEQLKEEPACFPPIVVTNYERVHKFNSARFSGIVLDESSIIKHHDAKNLSILMEMFRDTAFKLCATATPSPNDFTELGTHAEFLGICTQAEMLAEYFTHDGGETQKWTLKTTRKAAFLEMGSVMGRHAKKALRSRIRRHRIRSRKASVSPLRVANKQRRIKQAGLLFAKQATDLTERRTARKASIDGRVAKCAEVVNASNEAFIVWCDLNNEGEALRKAIPGAVEIRGSDDTETKEKRLIDFSEGRTRVLITKPSIAGFGLNWQHCHNVAFVGVTDSWEAYYQAVRRCWRFGQKHLVTVHVFSSEIEGSVINNLLRKERDANHMADELSKETFEAMKESIKGQKRHTNIYKINSINIPSWLVSEGA